MILAGILQTTFSVHKPLTGESMNSDVAPVAVVYANGVAIAPAAPPVIANIAAGLYSLTYALTAANGHAANDWVTITVQVSNDTEVVTVPVWEGSLILASADVTLLLGQTIYPMFTVHRPSDGGNQAPDLGAAPVVVVYRNLVVTGIVPVLVNPAVGIYMVTLPLTVVAGWAAGDTLDILATATVDGIPKSSFIFTGTDIVDVVGGGGGGVPHHEVGAMMLRSA